MLDLSRASGLDLRLDNRKHSLVFGKTVVRGTPAREVGSLKYRLYGGAGAIKDTVLLRENKLRFDLILLGPGRKDREMPRTPFAPGQGGFPKLYEAVHGEAWFILQKESKDAPRVIEDVILAKVNPGQKLIIPPGYGHILVNPAEDDLVACVFSSVDLIQGQQAKAAAYFIFKDRLGEFFQPNPYYQEVPCMRMASPGAGMKSLGLESTSPVYNLLSRAVERLDFLNNPAKYDYSDIFKFL